MLWYIISMIELSYNGEHSQERIVPAITTTLTKHILQGGTWLPRLDFEHVRHHNLQGEN